MDFKSRILITPGEPAGIGPDITLKIAEHQPSDIELIAVADPALLYARARRLNLPITLLEVDHDYNATNATPHGLHTLKVIPVSLNAPVSVGHLNPQNADYVLRTLQLAASLCLEKKAQALVTGPVHKGVMNDAGIAFSGHTEFFADFCNVKQTVMLFVTPKLKVALLTTHLPLAKVPSAITIERLLRTIKIMQSSFQNHFKIDKPRFLICGLNPHAGENGYLGREEIDIINPALNILREEGHILYGPLSADTIFTPHYLKKADAVLAMYHDQALPLVKYISFGHAVNMTLGLPFIRTSVDHGTALDLAGTNKVDTGSLAAAITLTIELLSIAMRN